MPVPETQPHHTRTWIWPALALFAIGVLFYAYAFNQSFQIDDFIQLRWIENKSLIEIWTTNDRGYYRPMSFMLWKLVHMTFGSHQPLVLHGLNVASHALNGALVFALLMRALPEPDEMARRWVSFLAALLFLAFPFSYQAVPWIGALNHPLAANFILLALLMGFPQREGRDGLRLLAGLAFTAIAIVTHENGVIVGPLLMMICAMQTPAPAWRKLLRRTWPYFVLAAALPIGIALLRNIEPAAGNVTMEGRVQNSVYFLQGLVYSIAPLAVPLMNVLNISDMAAALLASVPALLLLAGSLFLAGKGRIAMLAIGWYAIAIAPAVLLLPFSYVIDGPRLMYLASIGAALLVASQLLWLRKRERWAAPGKVWGVVVSSSAILFSLIFLSQRAEMYEQTRRLAEGLLREIKPSADTTKKPLLVNFPSWIAPRQPSYALGHEGVTFVPDYSSPMDLYYLHTGREQFITTVVLPHLQSEWRYNVGNHGPHIDPFDFQSMPRQSNQVLFVSTKGHDMFITDAGNLESPSTQAGNVIAEFGNTLRLHSQTNERIDAKQLRITLRWSLLNKPAEELRTFVHVFTPDGRLLAQEDGLPLMNMADPRAWETGDTWRDVRVITLPDDVPAGEYLLRVGVYRAADGTRLPAVDARGKPIEDNSARAGEWVAP